MAQLGVGSGNGVTKVPYSRLPPPGCKNSSDAATPDPAALKAQKDLIAKRDALLAQREELQGKRDKLDVEIQKVTADGGDTKELAKGKASRFKKTDKGRFSLSGNA